LKLLDVSVDKMNVHGGAVAFGHPIGMSGARIIQSLTTVLARNKKRYGIAAICNGGGGSSSILI
jgi:acetyl-CoA C-acetyltransferase